MNSLEFAEAFLVSANEAFKFKNAPKVDKSVFGYEIEINLNWDSVSANRVERLLCKFVKQQALDPSLVTFRSSSGILYISYHDDEYFLSRLEVYRSNNMLFDQRSVWKALNKG